MHSKYRRPVGGLRSTIQSMILMLAACTIGLIAAGPARGQTRPTKMPPLASSSTVADRQAAIPAPGSWSASLGAGALFAPAFPGAKTFIVTPAPLPDISYRAALPALDTIFLNTRDGLGVVVLRAGPFSAGGSIGVSFGRRESWALYQLAGMGDIDAAPRGSLFLRADIDVFGLSLQADRAFGAQNGTTVTFEGTVRQRIAPSITLIATAGVTWADSRYMQQWFGVDSVQSGNSTLRFPVYQPGSGLRSVSGSLTGVYGLSRSWSIMATAGITQLLGDAANSPIVETPTQPFGLLGLSYKF
jgi:outer membrane scaffolding protein for murein synthesis (MipA/OmpV family)